MTFFQMTLSLFCILFFYNCKESASYKPVSKEAMVAVDTQKTQPSLGNKVKNRFPTPNGFVRVHSEKNSFASYLQALPLKPKGTKVYYYDGNLKNNQSVHAAVIDVDVEKRDLQQCADAIMRLRAEYLFQQKRYDDIQFNFTNGFQANYAKWRAGFRIKVKGNQVDWVKTTKESTSYDSFRKYLTQVFIYAGTLSLEKELESIDIQNIEIGDVFIQGGSPGHAVIVVDMTVDSSGEKAFLLAQSYMPAQDIHILKNPNNKNASPWYFTKFDEKLVTPEWIFYKEDLKRFL